ncbi:response regulator [Micromonospora sp. NPDC047670]|uniref:response regulator n=1 Tax=Micromonospora sp. NPDC047670 TaxID=3364252 RepID=UPI00371F2CDA
MTVDAPARGLVLVVEDEPAIADLVRLYLTRDGFGVHLERDGAAGLAAARRLRPVACVLDIALPGLAGTEVCRRLRAAGDWTPVIFLTARDDEVDRVVGLELGADDYVTPPGAPVVLAVRAAGADPAVGGVVEVRDGGPGFTDDDLAVAFERGALHQRYRGVRKVGSGLGPALAAGLVRRLGGEIAAGHAREGGAAFTVRLPPDPYRTRTSA